MNVRATANDGSDTKGILNVSWAACIDIFLGQSKTSEGGRQVLSWVYYHQDDENGCIRMSG